MKKVFLLAAAITLLVSATHADPSLRLLQLFNRAFPDAEYVRWTEDKVGYLVSFDQNEDHYKIWYDKDGNLVSSIKYGQEKNLPLKVLMAVRKKFKDKNIFGVTELTNENGVRYRLMLSDDKKWYIVNATTDGSLSLSGSYKKNE